MKTRTYIGIDNGVTGSIGIIYANGTHTLVSMPIFKDKEYTKETKYLQRVNHKELLRNISKGGIILLERPMVNPRAFVATKSALRALESTLVIIEQLGYIRGETYNFVDSKEWQKEFFSSSIIGHDELKEASLKVGIELFPSNETYIKKHGDADGLLIAEYLRRKYNK